MLKCYRGVRTNNWSFCVGAVVSKHVKTWSRDFITIYIVPPWKNHGPANMITITLLSSYHLHTIGRIREIASKTQRHVVYT